MAKFDNDELSTKYCRMLIKKFSKDFGFIDPEHIIVVKDTTSTHSRFYAATSLVPATYRPFVSYRIIIRTADCIYDELSKNAKKLIMQHELTHIAMKDNRDYKLIHHDVEDFRVFLELYGISWAKRKDLPDILSSKVK